MDRRLRRGLEAHESCLLCDQEAETIDHLLVTCLVAKEVSWSACSWVKCVCVFAAADTVHDWWEHLVLAQPQSRQQGTSTLFMLVCWHLWKERNTRLFDRRTTPPLIVLGKLRMKQACG